MIVAAIAALSENRVIGRDNGLPWHIPEDLKHFKTLTLGKPLIMGRKTFESIGSKPLPRRTNIIVSRKGLEAGSCPVFSNIQDALDYARRIAVRDNINELMICGGAQIYEQALPFTDRLYLTIIHQTIDGDAFFPAWSPDEWRETSRDDRDGFSFVTLDRRR